jgi:hypothetical protein
MYIFGGQVDNYYLGDIVAMDMKTSKSPLPLFSYTPVSFLAPDKTQAARTLFVFLPPLRHVMRIASSKHGINSPYFMAFSLSYPEPEVGGH